MTRVPKQFQDFGDFIAAPGRGFAKVLLSAVEEFASFGSRKFDIAGYPYDTEAEALGADWAAIAHDFHVAATKISEQHGEDTSASIGRSETR